MLRAILLLVWVAIVAMAFMLVIPTPEGVSVESFAGMPAMCVSPDASVTCWLTIGSGMGVLFVGLFGAGLVCIGYITGGILFGMGQVAIGGICLAQAGIGGSFFFGQAGGALTALGQVVVGMISKGQASAGFDAEAHLAEVAADLKRYLSPF